MEFSECSEFSENRPPDHHQTIATVSTTPTHNHFHQQYPSAVSTIATATISKNSIPHILTPLQAGELQAVELPGLQAVELPGLQAVELPGFHTKGEQKWIKEVAKI